MSLGPLDVFGTSTVELACSLTNNPTVPGVIQTFQLTVVNPCITTSFVDSPIANSFGFITDPALTVKVPVPWLND
jgi:hypothetical protein